MAHLLQFAGQLQVDCMVRVGMLVRPPMATRCYCSQQNKGAEVLPTTVMTTIGHCPTLLPSADSADAFNRATPPKPPACPSCVVSSSFPANRCNETCRQR